MDLLRRRQTAISVALLAALAYLPALTASPGRMPADSKLYVYLDPGRFLADAATTFDPRQFGGWVPHQHIAYLWPAGPWYWLFDSLGVPDWIAHRLWIGTVLLAAGLGARWMTRVLGFAPLAALAAALVYQLSPYILPYVSRTSVLLLPFAGLGWIVGCTILAGRRGGWRYPAAIALIVLTVGAVNATALAMVIPAPALWLVHSVWQRSITWRRAVAVSAKTGLLCVGVSLWWIVMLVIQGRSGADVLLYSESLESVSFTSTSTEVTRGLGYWLFYVRDAYSAATASSLDHVVSGRTVFLGVVTLAIGLIGVVSSRWEHRRYAALLVGAGVILGVGVHPIDDPSPLMSLIVGDGEGGLALALRSSTRAVPVFLLGLGLGVASAVTSIGSLRLPVPPVVLRLGLAGVLAVTTIVGLPALRNGGFVDEALERDQDPPATWLDAADDLDARPEGYRVLQLPGTEFGAFQWGYTVDQPLPGLTDRPLLTRDLLPLGSPAAMDLLYALDDRVQAGTIEPDAVAAVSRLLGVDTIWVSGDVSYDRFRLARPEIVTDDLTSTAARDGGLSNATAYGDPVVMGGRLAMVDNRSLSDPRIGEPIAPVTLIDVADAIPTVRVKDEVVVLAGSGDGVFDAAAGGVIDGTEALLYQAADDAEPLGTYRYVITDSNRDRAHHWRSSQDVLGFTESASDTSDVLVFESADQRLPVFAESVSDQQTVSVQRGPVTARASSYGERFAYLPEYRPVMAIDGDPTTAWLAADRFDPIGEFIELTLGSPIDHLDLLQLPTTDAQRTITQVSVSVDGSDPSFFDLDESSRVGVGQRIEIEAQTVVRIEVASTTTPQPPIGEAIGGVGFAEISTGLGPTNEFIRPPLVDDALLASADGFDMVFSRLRIEAADRWRSDPEPILARVFDLPSAVEVTPSVTLRLDQRLDDDALAVLLGDDAVASTRLLGATSARGATAFDGDDSTAWTTRFGQASGAAVGQTLELTAEGTAKVVTIAQPGLDHSPITGVRLDDGSSDPIDLDLPVGAAAELVLPRPIDLSSLTVEITSVEDRFVQNRRFDEPNVLPSAISEILFDGEPLALAPTERLAADCRDDLLSIDGEPLPLSFDVATSDALAGGPIEATPCTDSLSLGSGEHTVVSVQGSGFHVDRVVLRSEASPERADALDPTQTVLVDSSTRRRTVEVPACPDGCWLVVGEGYNTAWSASVDGQSLGDPTLVDGNANGWWIEPSTTASTVDVSWTVQRPLNIAFALSALAALACLALVVADRRRVQEMLPVASVDDRTRRADIVAVLVTAAAAALLVDWIWAIPAAAVCVGAIVLRRPWIAGAAGIALVAGAGLVVVEVVRSERPFPDAGWPTRFEWLHPWTLLGIVLIATQRSTRRPQTRD